MARAEDPAARPAPPARAHRAAAVPAEPTSVTADDHVAPGMRIAAAWSWRILVVAAVIALVGFLIVQLRLVAIPFFVALLLAALLVPFSNWLQRKGWPKWLAVTVNELALVAVIAGLITVVVIQVRSGLPDLQAQTMAKYEELKEILLLSPLQLSEADIEGYFDGLITSISDDTSALVEQGLDLASLGGHILAGTLLALFVTLFILIDGRGIWNWLVKVFPSRARPAIMGAGEAGWLTLSTFVRVQIFVAAIDAVGIGLGAFILGLFYGGFPLVIPIAIAVFLASFVPVVGAVVSGGLAVFVALVYLGPVPALIMLGIVILVQQLEGHVLQPLLVGAAVKVHPVAVVLAVATGGFVAGIPGALFAVPLVAVLNVMVGYIARGDWRTNPHPSVADVTSPIVLPRRRRAGATS
ncbi:AI-2E family transporter [Pseudolysinimonas sp.]|uniref:AI-2E family transporter n=1 Tax=Pseudolysinimonas sp. TaxID=2680009 RepID=UPI00286BB3E8|nr:AI-2E family transporter [Pseudolysinimonas sp.]